MPPEGLAEPDSRHRTPWGSQVLEDQHWLQHACIVRLTAERLHLLARISDLEEVADVAEQYVAGSMQAAELRALVVALHQVGRCQGWRTGAAP